MATTPTAPVAVDPLVVADIRSVLTAIRTLEQGKEGLKSRRDAEQRNRTLNLVKGQPQGITKDSDIEAVLTWSNAFETSNKEFTARSEALDRLGTELKSLKSEFEKTQRPALVQVVNEMLKELSPACTEHGNLSTYLDYLTGTSRSKTSTAT